MLPITAVTLRFFKIRAYGHIVYDVKASTSRATKHTKAAINEATIKKIYNALIIL